MSWIQKSQENLIIVHIQDPEPFGELAPQVLLITSGWLTLSQFFSGLEVQSTSLTSEPGTLPPRQFLLLQVCLFSCTSYTCHAGPFTPPEPPLCFFTSVPLLRICLQLECSSTPSFVCCHADYSESHSIAWSFMKFPTTPLSSLLCHRAPVCDSSIAAILYCLLVRAPWWESVSYLNYKGCVLFIAGSTVLPNRYLTGVRGQQMTVVTRAQR